MRSALALAALSCMSAAFAQNRMGIVGELETRNGSVISGITQSVAFQRCINKNPRSLRVGIARVLGYRWTGQGADGQWAFDAAVLRDSRSQQEEIQSGAWYLPRAEELAVLGVRFGAAVSETGVQDEILGIGSLSRRQTDESQFLRVTPVNSRPFHYRRGGYSGSNLGRYALWSSSISPRNPAFAVLFGSLTGLMSWEGRGSRGIFWHGTSVRCARMP